MKTQKKIFKLKTFSEKLKDIDAAKGIVQMYVNSFNNLDSQNDISLKGSFNRTIKNNIHKIKHLYNHNHEKFLGIPIEMVADDFGLLVTSKMNLKNSFTKDIFNDYVFYAENAKTPDHSIGAYILDYEINKDGHNEIREYQLIEYSTVAFGADQNTPMISVKSDFDFETIYGNIKKMLALPYSDIRKKQIEQIVNLIAKGTEINSPQTAPAKDKALDSDRITQILNKLNF